MSLKNITSELFLDYVNLNFHTPISSHNTDKHLSSISKDYTWMLSEEKIEFILNNIKEIKKFIKFKKQCEVTF